MNAVLVSLLFLVLFTSGITQSFAGSLPDPAALPGEEEEKTALLFEDRKKLEVEQFKGKVLVLELAAVGCHLSGEVYEALLELRDEYPDTVEFVRVDHGQSVEKSRAYYRKHPPNIHVIGDPTGRIGKSFPSQAFPTLYLFGKWGRMRFMGGYDPAAFRSMLNKVAVEKKINEKNFFLKRNLDKGDLLPIFTLPDLAGKKVALEKFRKDSKALVLVFSGTSCPISRKAVVQLGVLARKKGYEEMSILVVNLGEGGKATAKVYQPMNLPFPVLVDRKETLVKPFGIESVPTIFVAGKHGQVALRSLWNYEAVKQEVDILLGKIKPGDRKKIQQKGSG